MIELEELQSYYPDYLKPFKKSMLTEYLQYKILYIIYNSKFYDQLIFMGGTAIRIIHNNQRFSEDLDFDNKGLGEDNFIEISKIVKNKLELEGYNIEIKNTFKNAYRCFLKINDLIYNLKLPSHKEEKIDIRLDTEPQNFSYCPHKPFINKFGIFTQIYAVPVNLLLSQKIYAIINRARPMGRDFYDAIFLMGKTNLNFKYLKNRLDIKNISQLKEKIFKKCETLDFDSLSRDIAPYIFKSEDSKKLKLFTEYINQYLQSQDLQ